MGDPNTIVLLVPFAMLLVGFIPASFSLITALETFVGERERNSLEALLAMPICDGALYLGKLLSSLLPPLLSSFVAMSVFGVSLRFGSPDLFFRGLTFEYIAIVVLLIAAKALVMVAGAVIISSHTTSIRAANLLASFVLLPTASVVQLEALLMIGRRWDVLVDRGHAAERRWRSRWCARVWARSTARRSCRASTSSSICARSGRPSGPFCASISRPASRRTSTAGAAFSLGRFYRHELPALLREYRLPLAVALVAALGGLLSGGYIGQNYRVRALDTYLANVGKPPPRRAARLGCYFRQQPARRAALERLLAVCLSAHSPSWCRRSRSRRSALSPRALGERGGSWLALGADSPLQFLLGYVLPHGIIELPTAILGAAMGIRIGAALMSPPKGFTVGQNILWSLAQFSKVWALVLLPLFLLGGLIEGLDLAAGDRQPVWRLN